MINQEYPTLELFERTPDLVCIVDRSGWFKRVNSSVIRTLGYSQEELFARPVAALIHPDDREATAFHRNSLLNNIPLLNFQNRYVSKTGQTIWLEWTSVYIHEKEIVFAIAKNITKRKQTEIKIEQDFVKYKSLAMHFKHHVEKDRQAFATELREELAQLAAVVKLDMEWLASQRHQLDEPSKQRLEHGLSTSNLLINKLRTLSYSISAEDIKEFGLDTVLRSLCQDFSVLSKIECHYKSSFKEKDLDFETKLDLLRICQEALHNVLSHSEASKVIISVQSKEKTVELTVADNGKGFEQQSHHSFGLQNMRGRAASINGVLFIESEKNKGTKVNVSVAIKGSHRIEGICKSSGFY